MAVAFGFFMGIVPIWGYQLIVGFALVHFFKLNKVLFVIAANISIPPMIPIILYLSVKAGGLVLGEENLMEFTGMFSFEMIKNHSFHYLVGSISLATGTAIIGGILTYLTLVILSKFNFIKK